MTLTPEQQLILIIFLAIVILVPCYWGIRKAKES